MKRTKKKNAEHNMKRKNRNDNEKKTYGRKYIREKEKEDNRRT